MPDAIASPLRADAARNREALIAAAREVFGERGLDAPLDEIARRAGVGNATLYRHFPTRQELVDAVFTEQMAEYADAVKDALADPDPWTGFRGYVSRILRLQADNRGLADVLVTSSTDPDGELEQLRQRAYVGAVALIAKAKSAGRLRADFVTQDLVLFLMANAGLVHRTADSCPRAWERVAAFMLDGLHADAATPAPPAPLESAVRAAMSTSCDGPARSTHDHTPARRGPHQDREQHR
jgi:AcrR family transcriptional regulator